MEGNLRPSLQGNEPPDEETSDQQLGGPLHRGIDYEFCLNGKDHETNLVAGCSHSYDLPR